MVILSHAETSISAAIIPRARIYERWRGIDQAWNDYVDHVNVIWNTFYIGHTPIPLSPQTTLHFIAYPASFIMQGRPTSLYTYNLYFKILIYILCSIFIMLIAHAQHVNNHMMWHRTIHSCLNNVCQVQNERVYTITITLMTGLGLNLVHVSRWCVTSWFLSMQNFRIHHEPQSMK